MLPFTSKLIDFATNADNKTLAEIKLFAETLEEEKTAALLKLQNEIKHIEENSKKFLNVMLFSRIKRTKLSIMQTVGNITFTCPLISKYTEALAYPHRPCCMAEVPGWYFIAFPELGQVLPVTAVESIMLPLRDLCFTKIDNNIFTKQFYEGLRSSNFAVFPFTADTWNKLNMCEKKEWPDILHQLRISKYSDKNKLPITSTTFLREIAESISPRDMGPQWALFVQLYFILYLFKQAAANEHFSIN